MIYDCFTFFNELDLLEIRLNILDEVVDKFVLVEATRTHRGNPKPLYFKENQQRFAPFLDKIIHIVVDDYSPVEAFLSQRPRTPSEASWAYENFQRQAITRGLKGLVNDDLVLVSDLDEIPTSEAVQDAATHCADGLVRRIQLSQRSYYMNYVNFAAPNWEWGPIAVSYATYANVKTYEKLRADDTSNRDVCPLPSTHLLRALAPDKIIRQGGWHFSYLGGIDSIRQKLKAFAHVECSTDEITAENHIREILSSNGDLFNRGDRFFAVPPVKCLPPYILDHLGRYEKLIFKTDADYLRRTRIPKAVAALFWLVRSHTPEFVKSIYFRLHDFCR